MGMANKASTSAWTPGAKCEVFSRSQQRWLVAEIIGLVTDSEGQWVRVKYGRIVKDIPPDNAEIRPLRDGVAENIDAQNDMTAMEMVPTNSNIVEEQPEVLRETPR